MNNRQSSNVFVCTNEAMTKHSLPNRYCYSIVANACPREESETVIQMTVQSGIWIKAKQDKAKNKKQTEDKTEQANKNRFAGPLLNLMLDLFTHLC